MNQEVKKLRQQLMAKLAHVGDCIVHHKAELKELQSEEKSLKEALQKLSDGQIDMFGGD